MTIVLVHLAVGLGISALLLMIGRWGYRHAAALSVVPGWEGDRIEHRRRVLRRGAVTCTVTGVLFAFLTVLFLP